MATILLATHSIIRWLVLIAGAWAVIRAWRGWRSRAAWGASDAGAVRLFVNAMSLQFVVGVILYAVSPLVRTGLADMGEAMRNPSVRYFVVEHVAMMLVAIAFAHIGAARIRKATSDSARFQTATIWMGLALAIAAGFVPWFRPLLPQF
ncbi:MAG TPA: hypothetical protein PKC83_17325 [Gemmatimonadaceae bacterium]|jgi:hypothetical protein|nr:MAG: hypothetical protein ABS52_00990 [Gemmatimonadetes bacterium SCN 70-22]HMN10541.1 hypothetical protein [Gemmatimonadaceae bacterium]